LFIGAAVLIVYRKGSVIVAPLLLAPLFFIGLFFGDATIEFRDVMRSSRELICYMLLVIALLKPAENYTNIKWASGKAIDITIYSLFLLLTAQWLFSHAGLFVDIPSEWFVINRPELDKTQAYSMYNYGARVSLTYGEPSYFGMILAGLSACALISRKYILVMACQLSAFIAGTTFGIGAVFILVMLHFTEKKYGRSKSIFFLVALVCLFISILPYIKDVVLQNKGASGYIRLYAPWIVLDDVLTNYPFGMPFTQIDQMIRNSNYYGSLFIDGTNGGAIGFDNGFINVVIVYGYIGVLLLFALFSFFCISGLGVVYILLILLFGIQNGGIFTFDKVGLLMFFYIWMHAIGREKRS